MSYIQKEVIKKQIERSEQKERAEIAELKAISKMFKENERAEKAKKIAFGEDLKELRIQFSHFFNSNPQGESL